MVQRENAGAGLHSPCAIHIELHKSTTSKYISFLHSRNVGIDDAGHFKYGSYNTQRESDMGWSLCEPTTSGRDQQLTHNRAFGYML